MLPDLSGEEVALTLREGSDVPIIMLTAKAAEEDRVSGLRLGADDYLVKPFSPRELVAGRRIGRSGTPRAFEEWDPLVGLNEKPVEAVAHASRG